MSAKSTSARKGRRRSAALEPLRSVVVPTDFSPASARAIEFAQSLSRRDHALLVLVHVVMPVAPPDLIYGSKLWDLGQVTRAAQTALRNWQGEVGLARSRKVKLNVRIGIPWREIIAAAKEHKAGLIVIPTHGRTGLSHYVLGSTAEQVVRHATCPVLVVRANP